MEVAPGRRGTFMILKKVSMASVSSGNCFLRCSFISVLPDRMVYALLWWSKPMWMVSKCCLSCWNSS